MPDVSLAVLLVEDDPGTATSLSRILALDGYRVDTATTIAATLDRDNWSDYFAVILDRKLPDGMADDVLPQLKQLAPNTALFVVTAYTDLDGTIAALRSGVVDYFLKPLNPEMLRTSLKLVVERQRAAEALRESEQTIRAIVETAVDAIITIDRQGTITTFNPAAEQIFGYRAREAIGQNVKMLMPAPHRVEYDDYVRRYVETGEATLVGTTRELTAQRKNGSLFPIALSVSAVEELSFFTGIVRDISERNAMQAKILSIATEEQRRIGQELHDGTQQELTGLGLLAQNLSDALQERSLPEGELAAKVAVGISKANQRVRLLARGLVPVPVDAEGLMSALGELAKDTAEIRGLSCTFTCPESVVVPDDVVATHLYRIAQEAVTNAIKHAEADEIEISLQQANGVIRVEVCDNGMSIDEKREPTQGVGLGIMGYRCSLIGGNLEVERLDSGGTRVACPVPVQTDA
jgi:two-component system CheB/CheR fusion protein